MNIEMNLSEVLFYLELLKKKKKSPALKQLNMMLYYLGDYDEVKEFNNKIKELKLELQLNFYRLLIHFIEDYEDCVDLRNSIIQRTKRKTKYGYFFRQQIFLSKSRGQALEIINEAKEYGIEISEERWADSFDSISIIKHDCKEWRDTINKEHFPEIYEEFCTLKNDYFDAFSLKKLKETLLRKDIAEDNRIEAKAFVSKRDILVKEFARRVSKGICQLCDKEGPFLDRRGNPFLEIHHIHHLSKGGRDQIDNVAALCPNCHRKMHHLDLDKDIKKITEKAIANMDV